MNARSAVDGLLAGYQRFISPLLPVACRFHPSCSQYAREAVEVHGIWRGTGLALYRLLRCQPFTRGGFDPVPARPDPRPRQGVTTG